MTHTRAPCPATLTTTPTPTSTARHGHQALGLEHLRGVDPALVAVGDESDANLVGAALLLATRTIVPDPSARYKAGRTSGVCSGYVRFGGTCEVQTQLTQRPPSVSPLDPWPSRSSLHVNGPIPASMAPCRPSGQEQPLARRAPARSRSCDRQAQGFLPRLHRRRRRGGCPRHLHDRRQLELHASCQDGSKFRASRDRKVISG